MNESVINPNRRGVSTQSTSSLKDLVFNPETGDFEQVERGTANEGDTVTKMTEDGFALVIEDDFCHNNLDEDQSCDTTIKVQSAKLPSKGLVFNPETNEFEIVEKGNKDDIDYMCFDNDIYCS